MEFREALGFLANLSTSARVEAPKFARLDPPPSYRHVPATAPSTRNVPTECGVFVENTRGRYSSGRIPVLRACTRSTASHVGRNRTGAGVSGSGSGARGRSSSSFPCSSRKRRSGVRSRTGSSFASGTLHQLERSLFDAGPKPPRYRRASSSIPASSLAAGGPTHSSASANVCARRCSHVPEGGTRTRSSQCENPHSCSRAGSRSRAGTPRSRPGSVHPPRRNLRARAFEGAHVHVGTDLVHAPPPLLAGRADPRGEERVVAPRDQVNRLAHERGLDHGASLERSREIVAAEALETRPEPDVAVRRVLVLDPTDSLERARNRQPGALEQELAREQRPVQLSLRERPLGQEANLRGLFPGRVSR